MSKVLKASKPCPLKVVMWLRKCNLGHLAPIRGDRPFIRAIWGVRGSRELAARRMAMDEAKPRTGVCWREGLGEVRAHPTITPARNSTTLPTRWSQQGANHATSLRSHRKGWWGRSIKYRRSIGSDELIEKVFYVLKSVAICVEMDGERTGQIFKQQQPLQRENGDFRFLVNVPEWVSSPPWSWHTQWLTRGDTLTAGVYRRDTSTVELGNIKWLIVFQLIHSAPLPAPVETKEGWAWYPGSQSDVLSARLGTASRSWTSRASFAKRCKLLACWNQSSARLCLDTA